MERSERDVLIYLLWREGGFRLEQIAERSGVGGSAISHTCRRVEQRLETDGKLRRVVEAAGE